MKQENSILRELGFWRYLSKQFFFYLFCILTYFTFGLGFMWVISWLHDFYIGRVIFYSSGAILILFMSICLVKVFVEELIVEYRAKQEFTKQGGTDYANLPFLDKKNISHIRIGDGGEDEDCKG